MASCQSEAQDIQHETVRPSTKGAVQMSQPVFSSLPFGFGQAGALGSTGLQMKERVHTVAQIQCLSEADWWLASTT